MSSSDSCPPRCDSTPVVSALDFARSELTLREAIQNFRGRFERLNAKRRATERQQGLQPQIAATYRILGNAKSLDPDGSVDLKLVLGDAQFALLSQKVVTHLATYLHGVLGAHSAQKAQLQHPNEMGADAVTTVATGTAGAVEATPVQRLIVGMSGGPDSTLALVVGCKMRELYGYEVLAVHCIHGLDPDDGIWLAHNQRLCAKLEVELVTPRLNIVYGGGVSPEDVSRAERYRALLSLMDKSRDCLVLGHQADDQVESMLLALKRGSGPQGLMGMQVLLEDERGIIMRPLLMLHKIEIEQLLVALGFDFVYDLSNSYLKFERNYVRLKVLPTLRRRFLGIDRAILRSQTLCAYEHDLALRYAQEQLPQYLVELPDYVATDEGIDLLEGEATSIATGTLPRLAFDFGHLDLSDKALVTMLLRLYLSAVTIASIDFNVIEQVYDLMLKEHDRNGAVQLRPSPFYAATFKDWLMVYLPVSAGAASEVAGDKQSLYLHLKHDVIQALSISKAIAAGGPERQGVQIASDMVFAGPYSYQLLAMSNSTYAEYVAQGQIRDCGFVLPLESLPLELELIFDYKQSLVLKPTTRRHSREIKKLFIEANIAPWLRSYMPLVALPVNTGAGAVTAPVGNIEVGRVLALGNVLSQEQQRLRQEFDHGHAHEHCDYSCKLVLERKRVRV